MPDLAAFQGDFAAALAGDAARLERWIAGDDAGLGVYRNTCLKGAIDALEANFPAVAAMVGPEWFRAAGREYVLARPPAEPALQTYGAGFAAWLDAFPPALSLPYLPGVARLDRLWLEALFSAEAEPLPPEALAGLDEAALQHVGARLHPSVRLDWSQDNSPALWLATRWPSDPEEELCYGAGPQGAVLCRPQATVVARVIGPGEFAFLAACRDGRPLAEAAAAALEAAPHADLPAILAAALADGLFAKLETRP